MAALGHHVPQQGCGRRLGHDKSAGRPLAGGGGGWACLDILRPGSKLDAIGPLPGDPAQASVSGEGRALRVGLQMPGRSAMSRCRLRYLHLDVSSCRLWGDLLKVLVVQRNALRSRWKGGTPPCGGPWAPFGTQQERKGHVSSSSRAQSLKCHLAQTPGAETGLTSPPGPPLSRHLPQVLSCPSHTPSSLPSDLVPLAWDVAPERGVQRVGAVTPDPCVYGPHSRLLVPDEPLPTHRDNGVQRGQARAMAALGGAAWGFARAPALPRG